MDESQYTEKYLLVQCTYKYVRMKYGPSTSEYKGNTSGYLPERRSREGRYLHGIARRSNEYEVRISFIAYTSVPFFSWASGQYTLYCPLSQLKSTERACTQKHGLLRLSAPSWNPRLRSRDMQWSMAQNGMMSLHSDVHCTTLDRSIDNYIHNAILYTNCLRNFEYGVAFSYLDRISGSILQVV